MIAEILFPVALDKTFTYQIPEDIKSRIKPGIRIYASFSHREKVLGYVIAVKESSEKSFEYELKQIDKIIDEKPLFIFEKFMKISEYISKKWYSPKGLVLASFLRYLPVRFKQVESQKKIELENICYQKSDFIPLNENVLYLVSSATPQIKNMVFSLLKENKNVVLFFPTIFALEVFKASLLQHIKEEDFKIYSSSIADSIKKQIITLMFKNEVKLLLTTKAGVFLPFNSDATFIVVDALNYMYKQFEQHPYYDTIDLIEKIAEVYDNRIIYISHIESVEFKLKRIKTIKSTNAFYETNIIDIKKNDIFSPQTTENIKKYMEENKKILVVSYSKYMAGLVFCPKCHWIKKCPFCLRIMRIIDDEKNKKYICVFCNTKEDYYPTCKHCGSVVEEKGYGSQRIYTYLKNLFPSKKIVEIDGRIIHSSFLFREKIEQIKNKNIDILVGTEIILNSVLDMKFDLIMMIVYESHQNYDYSYFERFMDKFLIAQNMLNNNGKFFLYTFNPSHYIFENLNNFEEVIKNEIELRQKFNYPPFCYFYEIEILSKDKEHLRKNINSLIDKINDNFKQEYGIIEFSYNHKVRKIRGKTFYHHRSYFKLKEYEKFFEFLRKVSEENKLVIDVKSV